MGVLVFRQCLELAPDERNGSYLGELRLTADERGRSRGRYSVGDCEFLLQLPRGTVLEDGNWLAAESGELLQVLAKPEAIAIVRAPDPLTLLRATYHLGNRHVPLEVRTGELRLLADPVLEQLARQLGATVEAAIAPFSPERGAYRHSH